MDLASVRPTRIARGGLGGGGEGLPQAFWYLLILSQRPNSLTCLLTRCTTIAESSGIQIAARGKGKTWSYGARDSM